MSLLDTNYQDQRLTPSQLNIQEVEVNKKKLLYLKNGSDPDHVVAELAYITPREKILLDIDLYGSLDGKPNNAPGGLDSLQGDISKPWWWTPNYWRK